MHPNSLLALCSVFSVLWAFAPIKAQPVYHTIVQFSGPYIATPIRNCSGPICAYTESFIGRFRLLAEPEFHKELGVRPQSLIHIHVPIDWQELHHYTYWVGWLETFRGQSFCAQLRQIGPVAGKYESWNRNTGDYNMPKRHEFYILELESLYPLDHQKCKQ